MEIKKYVIGIIYIAIFGIIIELIIPNNKLKKYVMSIISLLVIIEILTPVINILKEDKVTSTIERALEVISDKVGENKNEKIKYDFSQYVNTTISNATKEKVEKELMQSLDKNDIDLKKVEDIKVEINSTYVIEGITVYVNGLSKIDKARDISNIIEKITNECNVSKEHIKVIERRQN